jgi:hypothetical protein
LDEYFHARVVIRLEPRYGHPCVPLFQSIFEILVEREQSASQKLPHAFFFCCRDCASQAASLNSTVQRTELDLRV